MKRNRIAALMVCALALALGSVAVSAAGATVTIRVEGMHCESCASSIEKKLKATEGVEEVRVSYDKKEAWVKFDDTKTSIAKLRAAINSTGFKAVKEKVTREKCASYCDDGTSAS